jgi:hypothetical protein
MSFSQISAVPRPERCRAANPYWTKRGCRRSASQELVGMVERSLGAPAKFYVAQEKHQERSNVS